MNLQEGRNLSKQGEDVQILQRELSKLGYSIPPEEVEKKLFGEATHSAVQDFQQRHGLEATGVVDEHTVQQISAAVEALQPPPERFRAIGQVVGQDGIPLQAATVKAFDKELRSEELLCEATTDENGHYEITYTADQLRQANKQRADLLVRVFNREGTQLAESPLLFNAQPEATVNLVVEPHQAPVLSEYEHLLTQLRPLMENVQLAELTDDDITFLTKKTSIDQQRIYLLRQSAVISWTTGFSTEVLYGFARQNLLQRLDTLLTQDPVQLEKALQTAIQEHLIPATTHAMFEASMNHLIQSGGIPAEQVRWYLGVQQVAGTVSNQETAAPLSGYTVQAFDLDTSLGPKDLGLTRTNEQGQFALTYTTKNVAVQLAASGEEQKHRLRLRILDPQGQDLLQTEISATADQQKVDLAVKVPIAPPPPSPTLHEVNIVLDQQLPPSLLSFLDDHHISTLADIRGAGGISSLADLPVAANDPAVQVMEAHANLSVLSDDVTLNTTLIEKGYTSIRAIAETPQSAFMQAVHDSLGDFKATQLHVQAQAQICFLSNVLARARVDLAHRPLDPSQWWLHHLIQDPCQCRDCQAAVSPGAYLLDLIDYTTHHLTDAGRPIDLGWLTTHVHQPFADLVVSCEAVETLLHQMRLCIEVLRSSLSHGKEFPGESDYRQEAYLTLLTKLGTSYEELRLARTLDQDKRKALADRLGMSLGTSSPDRIEQLSFDLSKPQTLTELSLEKLFGLVDTTRDPLSDGAKISDPQGQITRWNLSGVEWGRNTDPDGIIYMSLRKFATPAYKVELYRDQTRSALVAVGERTTNRGTVVVSAMNNSGLSGSFEIAYIEDSYDIAISVVPAFLSWRLEYLRTLWRDQDRPPLPNAGLPIIDPDIIGPDDMRFPVAGQAPYDLWCPRRTFVDRKLADLKAAREANGLTFILKQVLGDPLPNLTTLQSNLTSGSNKEQTNNAIKTITDTLHLTIESFTRLMALKIKDENIDPTKRPTEAEWNEVYAILTQVEKVKRFLDWRNEEQSSDPTQRITLGAEQFWIALKEPDLKPWLANTEARQVWQQALRLRSQSPIIDPDLIGALDLKNPYEINSPNPAYQIWKERYGQSTVRLFFFSETLLGNQSGKIDSLIERVLGAPATDLVDLADRRSKGEDIGARLEQLSIDLDVFLRLLKLRTLILKTSGVLDDEWKEFYSILLQIWKRRQFAFWRDEEEAAHILLSPDYFVIPAPSQLPEVPLPAFELVKWRATLQARNDWQDTLQARIDQQQALKDGLSHVIDTCEEVALPILRDALLEQVGPANADLQSKAKWFTTNLLIDAQVDGSQKTTRIAQAIETLQMLLYSVRTGQLADTPVYTGVVLDDSNFDDAWQWIGSYATWRAAMFVFLYPENILVPTLRKPERQTPAFRDLVDALRPNRRLTPEQAREAASAYAAYFKDVSHLTVEASCTAPTRLPAGDGSNLTQRTVDQSLFYMFARGTSKTVYWSAYNPQDPTGYGQTFWQTVPGLDKAVQIVGAFPFQPWDDQHSILLFATTQEKGEQKFVMTTYDLLTQRWSGELVELDLPQKNTPFSVVVEMYDEETRPFTIAPLVVFCMKAAPGTTYEGNSNKRDISGQQVFFARYINYAGTDWADGDFQIVEFSQTPARVLALRWIGARGKYPSCLLVVDEPQLGRIKLGVFNIAIYQPISPRFERWITWYPLENKSLVGTIGYLFEGQLHEVLGTYILVKDRQTGIVSYCAGWVPPFTFDKIGLNDIVSIAPHSNLGPESDWKLFACQLQSSNGTYSSLFCYNRDERNDQLTYLPVSIAPTNVGPSVLTERLLEDDLQARAKAITVAYASTLLFDPPSNWVYLDEMYYFVPVFLALQLQQVGQYVSALDWFRTTYDYAARQGEQREIWYGFELEKGRSFTYRRAEDWLLDPLNPHQIAARRQGTYLRFTLLALIRCFLDYADAEFTRDTAESIPRARRLYMTALELLDDEALHLTFGPCTTVIGELDIPLEGASAWQPDIYLLKQALAGIAQPATLMSAMAQVQAVFSGNDPVEVRFTKAQELVRKAQEGEAPLTTVADKVVQRTQIAEQAAQGLLSQTEVSETVERIGNVVGQDFLQSVAAVTGMSKEQLVSQPIAIPWLLPPQGGSGGNTSEHTTLEVADLPAHGNGNTPAALGSPFVDTAGVRDIPNVEVRRKQQFKDTYLPSTAIGFCISQNPILVALRFRAELNLYKMRHGRNIAGDLRTLEPYVAPTDTDTGLPEIGSGQQLILPGVDVPAATPYRYTVLIERAKQQVSLAQQIEAAFLAALEKRDAEYYTLLKARQDASLAKAGVRLQNLRVTEAQDGVDLATLQQARAQIQADHYQKLLDEDMSGYELASLELLTQSAYASIVASTLPSSTGISGVSYSPQGSASAAASSLSTMASAMSMLASHERQMQEWELQESLALQDIQIGAQQVKIAQDHVRVVGQEQKIAEMQSDHAEAIANFLGNKFTSYELYEWMSGVLEGVYNYLLQQATATAQLALNQLAFERQQTPPPFIRADYWQPPSETGQSIDGKAPDRRGLTGSARLLQDITQLDQYRFETDQRKLQLSKTISVAQLAPEAFAHFMETGVLTFATPMDLFDRDFPGHYLRLIRRVRVSVAALIPPTSGIRATLTSNRVSRVVVGGDTFQNVRLQHGPDSVALSSPRDATGLFELDIQSEMLLPFEGIGVDTTWELRMPKAANQFDYRTIADVLFTIEYTALNSFTYYQQVIQSLNPRLSTNHPYSFRNQFVDQWYDLHHPEQTANPMTVTFSTMREDFPPNLESLKIQHVVLYFAREADSPFEDIDSITLCFTPQGATTAIGGQAKTVDGLISSRNGNGSSWTSMIGLNPVGTWELALPNNDTSLQTRFKQDEIQDILFVITYAGRTPEWPT